MKKELIVQLHADFEKIAHREQETDAEYWLARDLQSVLGYTQWRSFVAVIERAASSCENAGYDAGDHFAHVRKMVSLGSGAERNVEDMALTRYACYLVAQNGDSSKTPIAFAQTYFAVQTRKQEIIEQRLAELERVDARRKLTETEKKLSGIIFERLGEPASFARIRSRGDQALFGGRSTKEMKSRLGTPANRPLADFLPTITIKAKDFATEITSFNVVRDNLRTEPSIGTEHVTNNTGVRKLLADRGIAPESLPASEDIKKLERRLASEKKKLPKGVKGFSAADGEPEPRN